MMTYAAPRAPRSDGRRRLFGPTTHGHGAAHPDRDRLLDGDHDVPAGLDRSRPRGGRCGRRRSARPRGRRVSLPLAERRGQNPALSFSRCSARPAAGRRALRQRWIECNSANPSSTTPKRARGPQMRRASCDISGAACRVSVRALASLYPVGRAEPCRDTSCRHPLRLLRDARPYLARRRAARRAPRGRRRDRRGARQFGRLRAGTPS